MALHFRTIWLSDTHLGTRGCKAEELRDFLDNVECETLYLVGDIIDLWKFKTGFYWPTLHSDVVQRVLNKAKNGTRVIYIPGNHDELFRKHVGMHFNGVEIQMDAIHETKDGRTFLIVHGDGFDSIVAHNKSLAYIGGEAYEVLLIINRWFNIARTKMGYGYWSLSAFLKHKVKNIISYMDNYQHIMSLEAQKRQVDGVICGHIHHAEITELEFGKLYCNTGDWVESCTALVENENGKIEIIHWLEDSLALLDKRMEQHTEVAHAV
ncbi:MAG: UDP-2,3-diacylglucosamine diphosphatase [Methylovulum sp.]|jgi:UDP-2,3-diacylglucosamine pyrophosphatase LpxH